MTATRIGETGPEPPVRGGAVLARIEAVLLRVDRLLGAVLPPAVNPLAHAGALAAVNLGVAVVSGIFLLFWYVPSVRSAYDSVSSMAPRGAGLVRSLHRYSSDACVLFALLHATRLLAARRFAGARAFAWVTGVALVGSTWAIGWLGYWLVWDERAHLVALGSAAVLDVIPVFPDPLARTFLTDASVNPLLFLVVFFAHILVPLVIAALLALHLARVSRPRFLPERPLLWGTLGALLVLSLVLPAGSAGVARMTASPGPLTIDGWYLLPLWLTDRLPGGVLLALLLGSTGGVMALPRLLGRGRAAAAQVELSRCDGCELCSRDCPYGAITMVPRSDGRPFAIEARVDPSRCVACGVCAGACTPGGIVLPSMDRHAVNRRLDAGPHTMEPAHVLFACRESAAGAFAIDETNATCSTLPGYRVVTVPCAGWVHPLAVDVALHRGAPGVVVVSCGDACRCREGARWAAARFAGTREPALRAHAGSARFHLVPLDRSRAAELPAIAAGLRTGGGSGGLVVPAAGRRVRGIVGGAAVAAGFAAVVGAGAELPYTPPQLTSPELVVSFKHPGSRAEACRAPTPSELEGVPVHMRPRQICTRGRLPVRVRVRVDGIEVLRRDHRPRGLFGDASSIAVDRLRVAPGRREVEVAIGDTADPGDWPHREARRLEFGTATRRVVLFEQLRGFTWE